MIWGTFEGATSCRFLNKYRYWAFPGYRVLQKAFVMTTVGFKTKRLLVHWWLESFFRPALLHYRSLTPSAHSACRAGMCSIELNGMWRIGRPGSGNFHCKWLLSHQGPAFHFAQRLDKHTQPGLLSYDFLSEKHIQPYTQEDGVCSAKEFALHCRFSHETPVHREFLIHLMPCRTESISYDCPHKH